MPQLHLMFDVPTSLGSNLIPRGATVLDLSLLPRMSGRQAEALRRQGVRHIRTDVASEQAFSVGRKATLDGFADILGPVGALRRELSWLYTGLPLTWLLDFTSRHVARNPWPWWLQQRLFLKGQGAEVLHTVSRAATEVVGWVADARAIPFFADLLSVDRWVDVDGRTIRGVLGAEARAHLRFAVEGRARRLRLVAQLSSFELPYSPRQREVDCLFAMDAGSWVRGRSGWYNRYLRDFPDRLCATGMRHAFLPTVEHVTGLRRQAAAIPGAQWWALEGLGTASAEAAADVDELHSRWLLSLARRPLAGVEIGGVRLGSMLRLEVSRMLARQAHVFTTCARTARTAVERIQPGNVAYRNEFYLFGIAISAGIGHRARRIAFQHGTITRDNYTYQYRGPELIGWGALPAPDVFATFGRYDAREMAQQGYPADRLHVTGSLRQRIVQAVHREPVHEEAPIVLVCGTRPQALRRWLAILGRSLPSVDVRARLWVKPHPLYRDAVDVGATLEAVGFVDYDLVDGAVEPLFQQAHVTVTDVSTTALEAALHGCPVVCFQEPDVAERLPFVSSGFAPGFWDVPSASRALDTVLTPGYLVRWEPVRDAFLQDAMENLMSPPEARFAELLGSAPSGAS
jgi:hypothetical protein